MNPSAMSSNAPWIRGLWLLAVISPSLSCFPTDESCRGPAGFQQLGDPTPIRTIGVVGRPVEVILRPTVPLKCGGTWEVPDAVSGQVIDPQTQSVSAETILHPTGEALTRFTPSKVGMHRAVANFEPVGGRDQLMVSVGRDRGLESSWNLEASCLRLLSLSPDGLLCDAQLYRDGAAVGEPISLDESISGRTLVGSGHLWRFEEDRIAVWRDDGEGALTLLVDGAPDGGTPHPASIDCAATSGLRAFVLTREGKFWFYELADDGRLKLAVQGDPMPAPAVAMCSLEGEAAYTVQTRNDPVRGRLESRVLRWRFGVAGVFEPDHVATAPGFARELSGRSLTLQEVGAPPSPTRLSAARIELDGSIVIESHLLVPSTSRFLWPFPNFENGREVSLTAFDPDDEPWFVQRRERELRLERFGTPRQDGSMNPSASPGTSLFHAWVPRPDGSLSVWKR